MHVDSCMYLIQYIHVHCMCVDTDKINVMYMYNVCTSMYRYKCDCFLPCTCTYMYIQCTYTNVPVISKHHNIMFIIVYATDGSCSITYLCMLHLQAALRHGAKQVIQLIFPVTICMAVVLTFQLTIAANEPPSNVRL